MTRLIDPRIAGAVARRVAGQTSVEPEKRAALERNLETAVRRSEELVATESGIAPPPPVAWDIVDRATWADTNIRGMAALIAPLTERVAERLGRAPLPLRLVQRAGVSAEVGLLLGYVSRRVLGQYDVLVAEPAEDERPRWGRGRNAPLLFVGPNMIEVERRHRFVPEEFALWVALHEVTHRFQFAGVPWLRERFFGLVRSYVQSLELDAGSVAGRFKEAARRVIKGELPPEERNPIYLFSSEKQRELLNEIQALMAVVEGHGNYVMDAAGAKAIPSFQRMRDAFERRRKQTNVVQKAVAHAIGLEMKLRQYEIGQKFCETVVRTEGPDALAALWSSPDQFPSLAEVKEPELWLRRVA